jgi:serine/threonine-protein kinase
MSARTTTCDRERLLSLLDGQLPEPVEAEVSSHVASCETCQRQLETLAAEESWWQETHELLGVGWISDPTTFASDGRAKRVGTESQPTFLAPSDNPAMLGRLGEFDVLEIIGRALLNEK